MGKMVQFRVDIALAVGTECEEEEIMRATE
jgi:hypothetical protein